MVNDVSRTYLVSGGSRGLGLAFVRRALDQGHRVFTCARHTTPALAELQRGTDRLFCAALDLGGSDGPRAAVKQAIECLGHIDVLINNAAIGQDSLLAHTSEDEIRRIVGVNLQSTICLTRHVVRHMMLARRGVILTVSSICGQRGFPGLTVYSATKGALDAFTRSLARELGAAGIIVNAIAPGFFESDMSRVLAPNQVGSIRRRTPTGALASDEQVVNAAQTLLNPDANITGQVLAVDGGASIS